MKNDLENLIKEFLEYLEVEKGRSKNTVKNYYFYLTRFAEFSEYPLPDKITLESIRKYRLFLKGEATQEGLKKSTQNYHLIALRSFLKFLAKKGISALSPEKIELTKTPNRQIDSLENNDIERLLEAPLQTEEKEIIKLRDKAILELLFSTGLRVSELSSLTREQVDLKKDEFAIHGKGLRLRVAPLSNQGKFWIRKYLEKRNDIAPSLFVRHDKAGGSTNPLHLTPRSIQRIVQKYSKMAGIAKNVTPHTLRHSFAAGLLANGADMRSVQTIMGHSSITTTQMYTQTSIKRLKEIYNGRNQKKIDPEKK